MIIKRRDDWDGSPARLKSRQALREWATTRLQAAEEHARGTLLGFALFYPK